MYILYFYALSINYIGTPKDPVIYPALLTCTYTRAVEPSCLVAGTQHQPKDQRQEK